MGWVGARSWTRCTRRGCRSPWRAPAASATSPAPSACVARRTAWTPPCSPATPSACARPCVPRPAPAPARSPHSPRAAASSPRCSPPRRTGCRPWPRASALASERTSAGSKRVRRASTRRSARRSPPTRPAPPPRPGCRPCPGSAPSWRSRGAHARRGAAGARPPRSAPSRRARRPRPVPARLGHAPRHPRDLGRPRGRPHGALPRGDVRRAVQPDAPRLLPAPRCGGQAEEGRPHRHRAQAAHHPQHHGPRRQHLEPANALTHLTADRSRSLGCVAAWGVPVTLPPHGLRRCRGRLRGSLGRPGCWVCRGWRVPGGHARAAPPRRPGSSPGEATVSPPGGDRPHAVRHSSLAVARPYGCPPGRSTRARSPRASRPPACQTRWSY